MTTTATIWGRRLARVAVAASISVTGLSASSFAARAAPGALGVDGVGSHVVVATASTECPTGAFLSGLVANPANRAFPPPSVSVSCSDTQVVVRTNGIPTFPFVTRTPNSLRVQDLAFRFTLAPVEAPVPGALNLGAIGIAIDGLPIYGPFEAPFDGTAAPEVDGILDDCGGHAGPAGEYHVHATPACLPADRMVTPGAVVGYALDGYPIVAPVTCDDDACTMTRTVRSGWVQVSTDRIVWSRYAWQEGAGDLDRCNGMTGADGQYRYYAVATFPYFMGCYRGDPVANGGHGARLTAGAGAITSRGQGAEGGRPSNGPPPVRSGELTLAPPTGQPMAPRPRR
jgi:hypothetical protein